MKTAVVLAARKERDCEIPFPLLPFDEQTCLLDRTLSILRELSFTKILIVAGFRAELFRKYEADDVKIVQNKDYEFTSSMGSLAVVRDEVTEDFLLIEGDTIYEKKVIERLAAVPSGNCLAMTEESGNGDECFVETKSGFVTKITKDRHCVSRFEGELLGILRLTLETYHSLVTAWEKAENAYLNYEYLLMDVTDVIV